MINVSQLTFYRTKIGGKFCYYRMSYLNTFRSCSPLSVSVVNCWQKGESRAMQGGNVTSFVMPGYRVTCRFCRCQVGADQAQESTMNQLRGLKTEVRLLADQLQTVRAMTEALIRKHDIDWEAQDQYQFS